MQVIGAGFIITQQQANFLGLGLSIRTGLENHIRPYRHGRDLMGHNRDAMVIDFLGLGEDDVRKRFPEVYQHLLLTVKPERDNNNRKSYRDFWWIHGEPRKDLRPALASLDRYLVTVETSKHRIFHVVDSAILPDNKLLVVALADYSALGILSSQVHKTWFLANAGQRGIAPDVYVKTTCFDPFPFPDATPEQRATIAAIAEEMDATRKTALAENPDLTMTGLYNLLERVRAQAPVLAPLAGELSRNEGGSFPPPSNGGGARRAEGVFAPDSAQVEANTPSVASRQLPRETGEQSVLTPTEHDQATRGRVYILRHLHDRLDAAVAEAYGWPVDLSEQEVLGRLVALNKERRAEEAAGHVRWLRPDYQIPRFALPEDKRQTVELELGDAPTAQADSLPAWPKDRDTQPFEVERAVRAYDGTITIPALARLFKGGGKKIEPRLAQILPVLADYGRIQRAGEGRYRA